MPTSLKRILHLRACRTKYKRSHISFFIPQFKNSWSSTLFGLYTPLNTFIHRIYDHKIKLGFLKIFQNLHITYFHVYKSVLDQTFNVQNPLKTPIMPNYEQLLWEFITNQGYLKISIKSLHLFRCQKRKNPNRII